ncbi:SMI1/KNR4 family protein [Streptomyces sp. ID05-26A]|nr:SMI1/KNR4 family protein [Streptomyces sp. ID05-26A]
MSLGKQLSYVDEIVRLVGHHAGGFRPELDWESVEREFGLRFPADYRALLDRFPGGVFRGGCVYVPSPVANAGQLEFFRRNLAEMVEIYGDEGNGYLDRVPHRMFPEPGGLFLWGQNDSGGSFWWVTDSDDPDQWRVAYNDRDDWHDHPGPMSRVVHELLVSTDEDNLLEWDLSGRPVEWGGELT